MRKSWRRPDCSPWETSPDALWESLGSFTVRTCYTGCSASTRSSSSTMPGDGSQYHCGHQGLPARRKRAWEPVGCSSLPTISRRRGTWSGRWLTLWPLELVEKRLVTDQVVRLTVGYDRENQKGPGPEGGKPRGRSPWNGMAARSPKPPMERSICAAPRPPRTRSWRHLRDCLTGSWTRPF